MLACLSQICLPLGLKTSEYLTGCKSQPQSAGKQCSWADQRNDLLPEVKAVTHRGYGLTVPLSPEEEEMKRAAVAGGVA